MSWAPGYPNRHTYNQSATVQRPVPYGNEQEEHHITVSTTDRRGRHATVNVDICHLLPHPPTKKGQRFVRVRTADRKEYGPVYVADKVQRKKQEITVGKGRSSTSYNSIKTIRVLLESEEA